MALMIFPSQNVFGPSMAPYLNRALILGGFCFLAMTVCASMVVLSEPITLNIQVVITPFSPKLLIN